MPLPRRPLFPAGNRLPVTVTDRKLVAELMDLQRGGCVACAASLSDSQGSLTCPRIISAGSS